jgi:hypothetical protein
MVSSQSWLTLACPAGAGAIEARLGALGTRPGRQSAVGSFLGPRLARTPGRVRLPHTSRTSYRQALSGPKVSRSSRDWATARNSGAQTLVGPELLGSQ